MVQNFSKHFQKLKSLAKDCSLRTVMREQNENDAIHDVFASWRQPNSAWQRLWKISRYIHKPF